MAEDKKAVWSFGVAALWHTPTTELDVLWSFGSAWMLDEYVASGAASIVPVAMHHYLRN
jgi:hypothetical protein